MKKILHIIILFVFPLLVGCSSDQEDIQEERNSDQDVRSLYRNYNERCDSLINTNIRQLVPNFQSRSNDNLNSAEDLVDILTSLPEDYIANELSKYNEEEMQARKYDLLLALRTFFEDYCGEEETVRIYEFADLYSNRGGHDLHFVADYISGMSQFGGDNIVYQASMIDRFIPVKVTRVIGDPCLDDLRTSLYQTLLPLDEVDMLLTIASAIPGVDLVAEFIDAGLTSYELLKIARDYNLCRVNKW